ncbi:MAG TPA: START-like domain-containing protein [Prolixibacteraceae bacterium]|nr:START-like domain-containing protein [Prolixibacteraceae bacterium]
MGKQKFDLEYMVNCSPKVLYNRLSSASGLAEWFADDVSVNGKKYTFLWDNVEQEAELAFRKENLIVRFNWLHDETYFEFKITRDELTGDVSLLITDFADDDEIDEIRTLWDSQIATLKHVLGS